MYYIEQDIELINGITKDVMGFHYISRFEVDYVNKRTEIQVSSNKSRERWVDDNYSSPIVNFYELGSVPDFNEDPNNFILMRLVTLETTVFFGSSVKKLYDLVALPREDI
jgi:hypothetical protein